MRFTVCSRPKSPASWADMGFVFTRKTKNQSKCQSFIFIRVRILTACNFDRIVQAMLLSKRWCINGNSHYSKLLFIKAEGGALSSLYVTAAKMHAQMFYLQCLYLNKKGFQYMYRWPEPHLSIITFKINEQGVFIKAVCFIILINISLKLQMALLAVISS